MRDLTEFKAVSDRFEPEWTLEFQTVPEDTDRILDAAMDAHPLSYGR